MNIRRKRTPKNKIYRVNRARFDAAEAEAARSEGRADSVICDRAASADTFREFVVATEAQV